MERERYFIGDKVWAIKNLIVKNDEIVHKGSVGIVTFVGEFPLCDSCDVDFGWVNLNVDFNDLKKMN